MKKDMQLVFNKETGFVSEVISINYVAETLTTTNEEEHEITLKFEEVAFFEVVGFSEEFGTLYDHDIVRSSVSNMLYEMVSLDNGVLQFYQLDEEYRPTLEVDTYTVSSFVAILDDTNTYSLEGNAIEVRFEHQEEKRKAELRLKAEEAKRKRIEERKKFNIKIVRDTDYGDFHYACHNRETGEIDLIKVVYIGAMLLEENYKRKTFSFEEFEAMFESGELVEATPYELQKYAMSLSNRSRFDDRCGDCDCETSDECHLEEEESEEVEADNVPMPPADYDDSESESEEADSKPPEVEVEIGCARCGFGMSDCECELF